MCLWQVKRTVGGKSASHLLGTCDDAVGIKKARGWMGQGFFPLS